MIFTFIFFLFFSEGDEEEGYPCVSMDVGIEPGSKTHHKLQVGKREQSFQVILSVPSPNPTELECPSPTKLRGFVALKLTAVNVVTF